MSANAASATASNSASQSDFNGDTEMRRRSSRAKTYKLPPTPAKEVLETREKSFVLDGVALSSICANFQSFPKPATIIPPYNPSKDKHCESYYTSKPVTSMKTGRFDVPIEGKYVDRFYSRGPGSQYLMRRNRQGAGRSREVVSGHQTMYDGYKSPLGYNGESGFRRNTAILRQHPSSFLPDVEHAPSSGCSSASTRLRSSRRRTKSSCDL